jgi:hypothetical protein
VIVFSSKDLKQTYEQALQDAKDKAAEFLATREALRAVSSENSK